MMYEYFYDKEDEVMLLLILKMMIIVFDVVVVVVVVVVGLGMVIGIYMCKGDDDGNTTTVVKMTMI